MAERSENSVLISLRELRGIEEDRVKTEEEIRTKAEEDSRRAREESERRRREEEERRARETQDAARRERDDAERKVREEQLRLQEAENRARVEAQARIEHERMRLDMENQAEAARRKKPIALIVIATVLLLGVGGLAVFVYNQRQEQALLAAEKRVQEEENARLTKEIREMQRESDEQTAAREAAMAKVNELGARIANTSDPDQLKALFAQIEKEKKAQANADERLKDLRRRQKEAEERRAKERSRTGPKCDPKDPLCGI